jgi:hypothetical protein
VQLRNLSSGAVIPLDSAKANYKSVSWTEKGDGLAVLRGVEDKAYQDKLYSVVGFTDLTARAPKKVVFDPRTDKSFPTNRTISPNRPPIWNSSSNLAGANSQRRKNTSLRRCSSRPPRPTCSR